MNLGKGKVNVHLNIIGEVTPMDQTLLCNTLHLGRMFVVFVELAFGRKKR